MAIGYRERISRFFKYDKLDVKHNMKLEIVNFGWPKFFHKNAHLVKELMKQTSMVTKAIDDLVIRPIDIMRAGHDRISACGREYVYV